MRNRVKRFADKLSAATFVELPRGETPASISDPCPKIKKGQRRAVGTILLLRLAKQVGITKAR
jgi:hypothetical protein